MCSPQHVSGVLSRVIHRVGQRFVPSNFTRIHNSPWTFAPPCSSASVATQSRNFSGNAQLQSREVESSGVGVSPSSAGTQSVADNTGATRRKRRPRKTAGHSGIQKQVRGADCSWFLLPLSMYLQVLKLYRDIMEAARGRVTCL